MDIMDLFITQAPKKPRPKPKTPPPKEPFRKPPVIKPYVDPLKNIKPIDVSNMKIDVKYVPYTSYHEYKMPDLDPLTGKPRPKHKQRTRSPKPEKKEEIVYNPFPNDIGSSVGCMKRTFKLQDELKLV